MNYSDRLRAAIRRSGNPCLIGLDPHLELLPEEFRTRDPHDRAERVADFLCAVIELVAPLVPAVKPQSAFFEQLGAAGALAWERVVRVARAAGLLVIGDVKRGDIGSTSAAYARAFLESAAEGAACDAITVNPFFGDDGIDPYLEACRRSGGGIYVLVRTSNPASARYQLHGAPPLCDLIAQDVERWGADLRGTEGRSSVGAVVGATQKSELARLRDLMPHAPLLLPGYGAQGARAADLLAAFAGDPQRALVNSSRGVLFAGTSGGNRFAQWRDALRAALDEMISDLRGALA